MKTSNTARLAAVAFAALGLSVAAAAPLAAGEAPVKVGVLTCDVAPGTGLIIGSNKAVDCVFKPNHGKRDTYSGSIGRIGPDLGFTDGATMAWAVFAVGKPGHGALAGTYVGAGAEASLGVGLGAHALVGGFENGINLQPLSVQAQSGLNAALGVEGLTLIAR